MCSPHAGRGYTGKCWYLISAPDVFETLLNAFIETEHLKVFLDSEYVDTMSYAQCAPIIGDLIIRKIEDIRPLCDLFQLGSPITDDIKAMCAVANKLKNNP